MYQNDAPGQHSRLKAWLREHRTASTSAVVILVVILAGIATGLGLALTQRVGVGVSSTPSAAASTSPSVRISPMASPPPSATAQASPSSTPPPPHESPAATPTPRPAPAVGSLFTDRLATDPPPDFVPTISCEGAIADSDPVAIVRLHGEAEFSWEPPVLRDYADASAPRTACSFGEDGSSIHSLVDARHVVIAWGGETYAIVDLPGVVYHWFRLPTLPDDGTEGYGTLFAVSPTLDAVIWERHAGGGSLAREIYLTDGSGDHALTALPELEGGRCGSPLDSARGAYARTGEFYYALDQLIQSVNVLVAGRGTEVDLKLYPPDEGWHDGSMPLMAVWSPTSETLYYRVGSDVFRWTPGATPELFLSDTPWSHPTFTPDGRHLAYATDEGVYLVDMTGSSAPRLIRADGVNPAFLNSTQLWFQVLDADHGCAGAEPRSRIYSLNDGSEAPSIIAWVLATWPATSSSFP